MAQQTLLVSALALSILISGCGVGPQTTLLPATSRPPVEGPSATVIALTDIATATQPATPTLITTQASTMAESSTPLPNVPTPSLLYSVISNVFFNHNVAGCALPCWNNLRVGVSDRSDVQQMFDNVFGFSGFLYPLPKFFAKPPAGYERIGNYWSIGKSQGSFSLQATLNKSTGKLVDLYFNFDLTKTDLRPDTRIQHIIVKLGQPKLWLASPPETAGQGSIILFKSLMIYEGGISFYHSMWLAVKSNSIKDNVAYFDADLCLDDYADSIDEIGEPLVNDFENLTPIQARTYGVRKEFVPIQGILGISVEEIVRRATSDNHPCFPISVHEP